MAPRNPQEPARVPTQNLFWSEYSQEWLIEHFGANVKDSKNDAFPDCVINADALFQCLTERFPDLKGFDLVDALKDALAPIPTAEELAEAWLDQGIAAGSDPVLAAKFKEFCDLHIPTISGSGS